MGGGSEAARDTGAAASLQRSMVRLRERLGDEPGDRRTHTTVGAVHLTVSDLTARSTTTANDVGLDVSAGARGSASLGADGASCSFWSRGPAPAPPPATPASTTSLFWCPSASSWRRGSPTRRAIGSRSPGCPTTSSARRSISRPRRPRGRDLPGPPARDLGRAGRERMTTVPLDVDDCRGARRPETEPFKGSRRTLWATCT